MPIRQLPPLLVNQIAAGEVIERPASVVKELLENAIDAGAMRIDIAIESGGRELIRVSDDGIGIPEDELTLAIAPHATSKIEAAEDLEAIGTLGFRGEAIASIASVSRLSIASRPRDQTSAAIIETEGDQVDPVRPTGAPPGTTVTVRNLFFNTPARRKFLRTEQTETNRIVDIVQALALPHPMIAFSLSVDGRTRIELAPATEWRDRILDVLGRELTDELLELDLEDRGVAMRGLVGRPDIARGTTRFLRVFLNGRPIVDRSINHAIKEAYRGLIEPSRFPTIVLFLEMDPMMVDVNVHPTKAEVRFRNQGQMHGVVLTAVKGCLRAADLTPSFDFNQTELPAPHVALPPMPQPEFGSGRSAQPASAGGSSASAHPRADHAFVDYFKRLDPQQKGFVYSEVKQALAAESPELLDESPPPAHEIEQTNNIPGVRNVIGAMQVHSSFIVTQDEQGLLIIDQHALHERVMFEKLKAQTAGSNLESQRLLMPVTLDVDQSAIGLLDDLKPLFKRLGIEAEQMGPTALAVHAFPSLLFERGVEPDTFMTELLEKAVNQGLNTDPEAALHEVLDMMACKAAIKAGDRLSDRELTELLAHRDSIERSSNCPHGRPTTLRLTIRDLEKQFGRG